MSIIIGLVIVSILIALFFLIAFIWAVKNGQFEDDYSPSVRILFDDTEKKNELDSEKEKKKKTKSEKKI